MTSLFVDSGGGSAFREESGSSRSSSRGSGGGQNTTASTSSSSSFSSFSSSSMTAGRRRGRMTTPPQPRDPVQFVGLENQGATCYLNSLIQMMYMTPELRAQLYAVQPEALGIQVLLEQEAERQRKEDEEEEARIRAAEALAASGGLAQAVADPEIVKQLMDMGFSKHGSERAALASQKQGVASCLQWALDHSDDVDFDTPVPGSSSAIAAAATAASTSSSSSSSSSNKKKARTIPLELQRLFAQLQLADRRTLSTDDLTSKGFAWQSWDGRVQHDVHELVQLLLDALERSLVRTTAEKMVGELFRGTQVDKVECLECHTVSESVGDFTCVFSHVKGFDDLQQGMADVYERTERFEGDNAYACATCKRKTKADLSHALREVPRVLFVALQRFDFDTTTLTRTKITSRFVYPATLQLRRFMEAKQGPGQEYELAGVIVHQGSAHEGHYHAYLKDMLGEGLWTPPPGSSSSSSSGGQWFDFDDSSIRPVTAWEALNKPMEGKDSAYMLVYRSKPARDAAAGAAAAASRASPALGNVTSLNLRPPAFWTQHVQADNAVLAEARQSHQGNMHTLRLKVLCPRDVVYAKPYLTARGKQGLAQAAALTVDLRAGLGQVKEHVLQALGGADAAADKGVPTMADFVRLHVLVDRGMKDEQGRQLLYLRPGGDLHPGSPQMSLEGAPEELLVLAWDGQHLGRDVQLDVRDLPMPLTLVLKCLVAPSHEDLAAARREREEARGEGGKRSVAAAARAAGRRRRRRREGRGSGLNEEEDGDSDDSDRSSDTEEETEGGPSSSSSKVLARSLAFPSGVHPTGSPYPPCEVSVEMTVHLGTDATVGDLLRVAGETLGFEPDTLVLHAMEKAAAYKAKPLYRPPEPGKPADRRAKAKVLAEDWAQCIFDQAEILVEQAEARGIHGKYLADAELHRRNQSLSVLVRQQGKEDRHEQVDGRATVAELRMALGMEEEEVLELLLPDEAGGRGGRGAVRELTPSCETEAQQPLSEWGLRMGSVLRRKTAAEAARLPVRFRLVTGNDPAPKWNPEKPGLGAADVRTAEVSKHDSVRQAKAKLCQAAGLEDKDGSNHRLRMTRTELLEGGEEEVEAPWETPVTEEEQDAEVLVCNSGLMLDEVVLLEEGRLATKGEIMLQLFLWAPSPEIMAVDGKPVEVVAPSYEAQPDEDEDAELASTSTTTSTCSSSSGRAGSGKKGGKKGKGEAGSAAPAVVDIVAAEQARKQQHLLPLPTIYVTGNTKLPLLRNRIKEKLRVEAMDADKAPRYAASFGAEGLYHWLLTEGADVHIRELLGQDLLPGPIIRDVAVSFGQAGSGVGAAEAAAAAAAQTAALAVPSPSPSGGPGSAMGLEESFAALAVGGEEKDKDKDKDKGAKGKGGKAGREMGSLFLDESSLPLPTASAPSVSSNTVDPEKYNKMMQMRQKMEKKKKAARKAAAEGSETPEQKALRAKQAAEAEAALLAQVEADEARNNPKKKGKQQASKKKQAQAGGGSDDEENEGGEEGGQGAGAASSSSGSTGVAAKDARTVKKAQMSAGKRYAIQLAPIISSSAFPRPHSLAHHVSAVLQSSFSPPLGLHLWLQRVVRPAGMARNNRGKMCAVKATLEPSWPPQDVVLGGGRLPSLLDLQACLVRWFRLPGVLAEAERYAFAKYDWPSAAWTVFYKPEKEGVGGEGAAAGEGGEEDEQVFEDSHDTEEAMGDEIGVGLATGKGGGRGGGGKKKMKGAGAGVADSSVCGGSAAANLKLNRDPCGLREGDLVAALCVDLLPEGQDVTGECFDASYHLAARRRMERLQAQGVGAKGGVGEMPVIGRKQPLLPKRRVNGAGKDGAGAEGAAAPEIALRFGTDFDYDEEEEEEEEEEGEEGEEGEGGVEN